MPHSKLITILLSLDASQLNSFRKHCANKTQEDSDKRKLLDLLFNFRNSLHKKDFLIGVKNDYFPQLSDKGFSNLQSILTNWFEDWVAIEYLQSNPLMANALLIDFYNNKGLYQFADRKARESENIIKKETGLSIESLESQSRLLHLQYYSNNPIKKSSERDYLLELVSKHLLLVYSKTSIYLAELYNRSSINDFDYNKEIQISHKLLDQLAVEYRSEELNVLSRLVKDQSLEALLSLKNMLNDNRFNRNSQLHTIATMYAISFSLKMWMKSAITDKSIVGDLYHYGLRHKVLMNNGKIPLVRFHNILSTLGLIQDYDWCDKFIQKWYKFVETGNKDSTLALANAQNAFYHNKYNLILTELRNVEFENPIQKTRALGLNIIGIYTDQSLKDDLLIPQINNFQRYLRRNKPKLSKAYFKSHYNLSLFIQKLYKSKYNKKIKVDIEEFKPIIYRSWAESQL